MKANTFIVGAPKAGTTSLHYYLSQHEDVCMSTIKEPNYFSFEEVSTLYYNATSVSDCKVYHKLFKDEKKIIGEASVSYLFYKNIPSRILEYNPKANIIIMLRNPLERAISHYLMDHRLGFCSLPLEDILDNRHAHPLFFQQYLELGLYYQSVKRYLDTFGDKQVHILYYTDFKRDIESLMKGVFQFLKIENTSLDYSVQNPFLSSDYAFVSYLYRLSWVRKGLKSLIPQNYVKSVKNRLFSKTDKPNFSESLLSQINAFYQSDISQLESLLNVDLSQWKKD